MSKYVDLLTKQIDDKDIRDNFRKINTFLNGFKKKYDVEVTNINDGKGHTLSGTSGLFSTASVAFVDVTNLSAPIASKGGHIAVSFIWDRVLNTAGGQLASTVDSYIKISRNDVAFLSYQVLTGVSVPSHILNFIDYNVPAGDHTYTMQVKVGSGTFYCYNIKMELIEL